MAKMASQIENIKKRSLAKSEKSSVKSDPKKIKLQLLRNLAYFKDHSF